MDELKPEMSDVQKLYVGFTTMSTLLTGLKNDFDHDHKILIEGNGQKPLTQRVDDIESYVKGMKFWLKTIGVAMVLGVLSFIGYGLVLYIQVLPVLDKISTQIK